MTSAKKWRACLLEYAKRSDLHVLECPDCSRTGCMDARFLEDPETWVGTVILWCRHCLVGVTGPRVTVPSSSDLIPFGDSGAFERNLPLLRNLIR
jgi:hypothetical protein